MSSSSRAQSRQRSANTELCAGCRIGTCTQIGSGYAIGSDGLLDVLLEDRLRGEQDRSDVTATCVIPRSGGRFRLLALRQCNGNGRQRFGLLRIVLEHGHALVAREDVLQTLDGR